MMRVRVTLGVCFLSTLGLVVAGCSGGGSSGGGFSTSAATTSSTTGSSGSTTSSTAGPAAVTSLIAPALVTSDTRIAYRLTQDQSQPGDVVVRFSTDNGQTWSPATAASGSAGTTQVPSAPVPGLEHTWTWASASDIPGYAPSVLLEVGGPGGATQAQVTVDNQPLSTAVTLNRLPFLQRSTPSEIRVHWRTDTPTDSVIEYGPTPALGQTATGAGAPDVDHKVTLTGLAASSKYYYRIVAGGAPITTRYSFTSAPNPSNRDFSFVVVGDSGENNPEQYAIGALMAQQTQASFFLHTGDVIYPAGGIGQTVTAYNDRFFKPYESMLTRIPTYPVIGNHDLLGLFGVPFRDTFDLPPNGGSSLTDELYFSFTWGDAKFIALETNILYQFTPFGAHMTWLKNELQNNTKKWLIVYMHTPLYSAGLHGDHHLLQGTLEPLFEANGVDLVLGGHDHDYERTVPIKAYNTQPGYPGLVHVVTGGGGANLRSITPNSRSAVALSVHHFLRIDIQGDLLHGTAIDINNNVIDQFTIREH